MHACRFAGYSHTITFYVSGMKRRQMYSKSRATGNEGSPMDNRKLKQSSFVMKAVNTPVKKVMANHKSSIVCSIM